MSSRTRLGWDPFFESQCTPAAIVARVIQVERDAWRVDGDAEGWMTIAGRMRHAASGSSDFPAVGDWVEIGLQKVQEVQGVQGVPGNQIVRRLERKSVISRTAAGRAVAEQVIAANIDTVFIVTSANEDLSERRLDRYLAMIWDSGAVPVVVVNKCDLVDDPASLAAALRVRLPFVDVVTMSALSPLSQASQGSGESFDSRALLPYLQPGRTVALVGSSGVGKSTIVNRLVGMDVQKVSAIREHDGTGRHTTTTRQLIVLPEGALLIDTPGMRELQPWGDGAVDGAFHDIAALAAECRFADCAHSSEPGCAVQAAVEAGTLSTDRLEHYRHLQRQAAYEARRHDKAASADQKRQLKTMMRRQRALYRDRERLK